MGGSVLEVAPTEGRGCRREPNRRRAEVGGSLCIALRHCLGLGCPGCLVFGRALDGLDARHVVERTVLDGAFLCAGKVRANVLIEAFWLSAWGVAKRGGGCSEGGAGAGILTIGKENVRHLHDALADARARMQNNVPPRRLHNLHGRIGKENERERMAVSNGKMLGFADRCSGINQTSTSSGISRRRSFSLA